MTWPVPILTTKSPRPTEESNLFTITSPVSRFVGNGLPHRPEVDHLLVALVPGLGGVLEPAGVLDGDGLAFDGDGAGALRESGLGNTHDDDGWNWCELV